MIPGPFSYHRPATVADAVNLLSTLGDEARPLAGGHSLVPMMKLRLASPEHLVDLHGVAGLKGIRRDGNKSADQEQKDKAITEDQRDQVKEEVQELTKKFENIASDLAKKREAEVMEA